jgi:hypothetical protein
MGRIKASRCGAAWLLLVSTGAAWAGDPADLIRVAVERCRSEQAARPPRVGPTKDGKFFKNQELGAEYRLRFVPAMSPHPTGAIVDLKTTIVNETANTEEAARDLVLSPDSPNTSGLERRYTFAWQGDRWLLTDAAIRPILKAPPGLSFVTIGEARISPDQARGGSDAGPTCIQTIEASR